ncbi:rRNA maturation RNase YbeY [Polycladidibacter hongkongensis]|uniref:rRNA maturation RNase YbeY n=1 Tax=Polycladidibacter hongkongensis TaxID=1647556 RepID=UPI000829C63F|nr:rRNA maturation RNase YbeY [Pseudovibrio hongkongensis]
MQTPPIHLDILIEDENWPGADELDKLARAAIDKAVAISSLEYAANSEISLVFTNDNAVQKLNNQWRGKNKPTNVLSFPGDEGEYLPYGPLLGDIVIARETVEREAAELDTPFSHHLTHLIVHGTLHLFGYDHQISEEAEEMEGEERKILAALGIPDPYKDAPLVADD